MVADTGKTIMCNVCTKIECRQDYPGGIPSYCAANRFHEILERTKTEYSALGTIDIYKAAARVVNKGVLNWPRIQEAIEFAKELKLERIGFASCIALSRELRLVTQLFSGAGFHVVATACQIGRIPPEARGVTDLESQRGAMCNPIAQAEILNSEHTQLNFAMGLCMGHDILVNRFSEAPVSTLIVKDRITGHNPSAVLYSYHYRRFLAKKYCDKDDID